MYEVICAGFGGQGVLTAGVLLAYSGMKAGKKVTWYPSYGGEMRGGTANCNVKISDDEIASPYCKQVDILLVMNEASVDRFESRIKPNGKLIVNSSTVSENREYRDDITVHKVPATDIAMELDNPRGANLIMLGHLIAKSNMIEKQILDLVVEEYFGKKVKDNSKNVMCLDKGYYW